MEERADAYEALDIIHGLMPDNARHNDRELRGAVISILYEASELATAPSLARAMTDAAERIENGAESQQPDGEED